MHFNNHDGICCIFSRPKKPNAPKRKQKKICYFISTYIAVYYGQTNFLSWKKFPFCDRNGGLVKSIF